MAGGLVAALKCAFPVALGVGVGIIAPPTLTRMILKEKDSGLMGYGGNLAVAAGGFMVLRKVKGGKFAAPFLAGAVLQLAARVTMDYAPDIGSRIGLTPLAGSTGGGSLGGVSPSAYMGGVEYMGGVQRVGSY